MSSEPSLDEILAALLAPKPKPSKALAGAPRATNGHEAKPVSKLSSPLWVDKALILLVTRTHCRSCNSLTESSHPVPFIQRYHPTHGTHSTPLCLRTWSPLWLLLPRRKAILETEAPVCHLCFDDRAFDQEILQLPLSLVDPGAAFLSFLEKTTPLDPRYFK